MHARLERERRTRAYNQVGIIRCAEFLATRKILNPSDQLTVVFGFLSGDGASVGIHGRPKQWMEGGLEAEAQRWHAGGWKAAWPVVLDPVQGPIEWAPQEEFGSLLSTRFGGKAVALAARRLRLRGVDVDWATLVDLRDDFTTSVLPRAVHTFDPARGAGREEFWLSTLFYRYALKSIRSDHARREQLDLLAPFWIGEPTPEEALLKAEREAWSVAALGAMDDLSVEQQLALRMYFGMEDREWTLHDIGQAIGLNRLKARTLVVHALARLALASGAGDRLGDAERAFARKMFDEGMTPTRAAREMGVSAADMGARIASSFEGALRPRTFHRDAARRKAQGNSMSQVVMLRPEAQVAAADGARYLNGLLVALDGKPRFEDFGDGVLRVDLGGALFDLASVRKAVTDDTVDVMLSRGLPIDWLLSGPARREPGPLADELEAAQSTRWETASELLDTYEGKAGTIAVTWAERDLAVRQVCTVLISVAQALDRELPAAALVAGGRRLLVRRLGNGAGPVSCWWDSSPPTSPLDTRALFRQQAMAAGGFPEPVAEALGAMLAERLLSAEFVPDGFTYAGRADGATAFERPWLEMDFD